MRPGPAEPAAPGTRRRAGADEALQALRRARRIRRLGDQSWADAAYRAYVTGLAGLAATYGLIGVVGDQALSAAATARLVERGPAWVGLGLALVLVGAVRSGTRGGPLAVEAADVQHVLLSPHRRTGALARPAAHLLASGLAGGVLAGALAGALVSQRLHQATAGWLAAMSALGGAAALAVVGTALVVGGRRVPAPVAAGVAWALVAWSVADLWRPAFPAAPGTVLAALGFWPARTSPGALAAAATALALAGAGLGSVGGVSIEAARRRTALVSQLRFAVTQYDVRTVVLLRRQLAAERHRDRPWFAVPTLGLADRAPVAVRDVQSLARWPAVRVVRVLALAGLAGAATAGFWAGTTPLVVVAGVASFVAALDAAEPLAQELDHPTRLRAVPRDRGEVLVRHLPVPFATMVIVGALAAGVALALRPDRDLAVILALGLVPGAAAAVAGAAVSVVSEPLLDVADEAVIPPEVAGPQLALRVLWPPTIAVLGLLPLFVAQRLTAEGLDPGADAATAVVPVVVMTGLVAGWVRFRDDLHRGVLGASRPVGAR